MDVGNALRFVVRSAEGSGVGNRIALSITSIDGTPVSETLVTAGDNTASQAARVYAGASLRDGYAVQGTVTFTFTGSYPPIGSALDLTITAGNVTCEGAAGAAQLYYVSTDHLGTPRAISAGRIRRRSGTASRRRIPQGRGPSASRYASRDSTPTRRRTPTSTTSGTMIRRPAGTSNRIRSD